jgi:dual specificity phosphatase 12
VALQNKLGLAKANITHVVSVLRMNPKEERFDAFEGHLHIPVDDVEEDDLLQYFPSAIAFIKEGLQAGGGVLVHWLAILFCVLLNSEFYREHGQNEFHVLLSCTIS